TNSGPTLVRYHTIFFGQSFAIQTFSVRFISYIRQNFTIQTFSVRFISYIRQNFTIQTFSVRFISYIRQSFAIQTFSVRFISYIRQNFTIQTFSVRFTSYIRQNSAIPAFSVQIPSYIDRTQRSSHSLSDSSSISQKLPRLLVQTAPKTPPLIQCPIKKYLLPTKETGDVKFHLLIYKHV